MDWINNMDWMANVRFFVNFLWRSNSKKRTHPYGIIEETSECNILEHDKTGSLIIAPFRDRKYKHTVLIWNPQTIRVISKFSAFKLWTLWDNYYAVLPEGLPSVKNVIIYMRSAKAMKKIKNVTLTSNFSCSLVQHVLGCRIFKTIYILEDYRLCMVNMISKEQQECSFKEKALQAFIYEELKLLVIVSEEKVRIYPLDDKGRVKDIACCIPFQYQFAAACVEDRVLSIVTYENRTKDVVYTESDEDEDEEMSLYLSKFGLEESGYDVIQNDMPFAFLPQSDYKFEFVTGNKVIACMSAQKSLVLLSISTGEVLFKDTMIGKVLKVHPQEGAIFVSSESDLKKLNVDTYLPC